MQQASQPHKSCPEGQGRDISQRLDRSILTPALLLSTSPHRQLGLASCNDLIPGLLEGLAMGLVLHLLLPLTAQVLTLEGASSYAWLPPDPARRLQIYAEKVTRVSSSRVCSKWESTQLEGACNGRHIQCKQQWVLPEDGRPLRLCTFQGCAARGCRVGRQVPE